MYNYSIDNVFLKELRDNLSEKIPKILMGGNILERETQKELIELMINQVIKLNFNMFMGYEKYSRDEKDNYRNGSYSRKLMTPSGEMEIKVPVDRKGTFYPECLTKCKRRTEDMTNSILNLFSLGNSNKEVTDFLSQVFGDKYSPQNISNITKVFSEVVEEFKSRKLKEKYIAIYIDATYVPIQFDNKYDKQALHLLVGINEDGYQDIVGYVVGFSENQTLWEEALQDIQNRGVKEVDLFISDGVVGIDNTIRRIYPSAKVQLCTVHVLRNLKNKIKVGDKKEVIEDILNLFRLTSKESIDPEKARILEKWDKYKDTLNATFQKPNLFTYLLYPSKYQTSIKTTNRIEGVNQKIKQLISHKQQFPNVESFERILVSGIIKLNNNSKARIKGYSEYIDMVRGTSET